MNSAYSEPNLLTKFYYIYCNSPYKQDFKNSLEYIRMSVMTSKLEKSQSIFYPSKHDKQKVFINLVIQFVLWNEMNK